MDILSGFRTELKSLFRVSITAYETTVPANVIANHGAVDMATQDVGDVNTFSGILAYDRLALSLVCGIYLVTMEAQECFIVDREKDFVGLKLVEAKPFIFDTLEHCTEHRVNGEIVVVGGNNVDPPEVILSATLVASQTKTVHKELGPKVEEELLVEVNGQQRSPRSVRAHREKLVKTTVAVHEITAEEDDYSFNAVCLAKDFGFLG